MFDHDRARTYTRGALALTLHSSEPVLYFKGSWAGNPGKPVSPELATFLQKGHGGAPLDDAPPEVQQFLRVGLNGLGYGAQILPGPHFTMSAGTGDVYGCAVGGVDKETPDEPLAYRRALPEDVARMAEDFIQENAQLTAEQTLGVRFALRALGMKVAPVQAYQVTGDADALDHVVETVVNGRVESKSTPEPGDWIVKQAAGEVQIIKASTWIALGYVTAPIPPAKS